jgi:transcriptional regulator with XRE-family HTH domain
MTTTAFIPWKDATNVDVTDLARRLARGTEKPMPERIEGLIMRTGISYYDLAKAMGVARSTVHDMRKGLRPPSKKFAAKFNLAEERFEAARRGEGVFTRNGETLLLFALNTEPAPENLLSSPDTMEARKMGTDSEPEPAPIQIRFIKPSRAEGTALIIKALTHNKCDELIMGCLSSEYANQNFVENLDQASYLTAMRKCVQLILGRDWAKNLQALIQEVEQRKTASIERLFPTAKPEALPESGPEKTR